MAKLEGMAGATPSVKNSKEINRTQDALEKKIRNLKVTMSTIGKDFNLDP
jgi:hypothetical protein